MMTFARSWRVKYLRGSVENSMTGNLEDRVPDLTCSTTSEEVALNPNKKHTMTRAKISIKKLGKIHF